MSNNFSITIPVGLHRRWFIKNGGLMLTDEEKARMAGSVCSLLGHRFIFGKFYSLCSRCGVAFANKK